MNEYQLRLTPLEYQEGVYNGNPYANIVARVAGKLIKLKIDAKKVQGAGELLDKECEATFEIIRGDNLTPVIRITKIEEVE